MTTRDFDFPTERYEVLDQVVTKSAHRRHETVETAHPATDCVHACQNGAMNIPGDPNINSNYQVLTGLQDLVLTEDPDGSDDLLVPTIVGYIALKLFSAQKTTPWCGGLTQIAHKVRPFDTKLAALLLEVSESDNRLSPKQQESIDRMSFFTSHGTKQNVELLNEVRKALHVEKDRLADFLDALRQGFLPRRTYVTYRLKFNSDSEASTAIAVLQDREPVSAHSTGTPFTSPCGRDLESTATA